MVLLLEGGGFNKKCGQSVITSFYQQIKNLNNLFIYSIMPELFIRTNVAKDKLPKSILQDLTKLVSSTIPKKPEKYVCVTVVPDLFMSFDGTEEPCAFAVLTSISDFNAETCTTYAEAMLGEIYKLLGVAQDRMYLEFNELTSATVGFMGTSVHKLGGA